MNNLSSFICTSVLMFIPRRKREAKKYMEKLEDLLVPKEEIQEEPETKEEAMDCSEPSKREEVKESKVKEEKVIKFGKTDEEYEEKVAAGEDGPSSSSKKSSEKKSKKEKGQISVMDMFKKGPKKRKRRLGFSLICEISSSPHHC